MNDGFLSQDEINALLQGNADETSQVSTEAEGSGNLEAEAITEMERDALGEIGNISMGSAATTLSVLLGRRVDITTPRVSVDTLGSIKDHYPLPYLVVEVGYTVGIDGNNILAIQEQDALIIADLMMGGEGTNPPTELNELYMSAVGEAMNQMMGSVSTSLSTMFSKKIDISPPKVNLVDLATSEPVSELVSNDEEIVKVAFRMEVEGLIDSEIMQILPIKIAKEMVESLMTPAVDEPAPVSTPEPIPTVAAAPTMASPAPQTVMPEQQPMYYATTPAPQTARVAPGVPVQPVQFAPLTANGIAISDTNLGLIMDVPLQVTVELGRTKKLIKDILDLATGSIIELDKLAGEPVDILVNGKLLAKGEVVVIDENFGVRITDIVSPMERARNIQ
ncbi:MAG: CheC, inhibitor of methylation / FliN fusion protein [Pelosinus sp.]|jgi:flagellar motor switch protein FliN/FliY|nr:CheC, inhibitor of methylation / FliN fusion protein [Pelosinus sp.]